MATQEKLWTIRQLAKTLNVSVDTIRERIHSGAIRASNVGTIQRRTWVIRQSALDDYLDANSNQEKSSTSRRRKQDNTELEALLSK